MEGGVDATAVRRWCEEVLETSGSEAEAWSRGLGEVAAAVAALEEATVEVAVLSAGDGIFAGLIALALPSVVRAVTVSDGRYFQPTSWWAATLPRLEAMERTLAARGTRLAAQREPRSIDALAAQVAARSPSLVVMEQTQGLATLRGIRCFERLASTGACVVSRPRAPADAALRAHAAKNALFAPLDDYQFAARDIRGAADRDALWAAHIRRAVDVVAFGRARRPSSSSPVVWGVVEQLDDLRRRVFDLGRSMPDADGYSLEASSPDRYANGGYADDHYVKQIPNQHEACFELAKAGERIGFVSFGAETFASADWPFAQSHRPLDVCAVTRLVVKRPWRASGASARLLRAADVFHDLGIPVRITTRKAEVADKVFRPSPLWALDDAPRRQRQARRAARDSDAALALVPYVPPDDPAAADLASGRFFHSRLKTRPKSRGNNVGWTFWYVGRAVLHPQDRRPFIFVGGSARFAAASAPPGNGPESTS